MFSPISCTSSNIVTSLFLQNEAEAVGLVGVDGVGVHGAGAPAVVSSDSVYLVIDVDVYVVSVREIERMHAAFKIFFAVWPCPEIQFLKTGDSDLISSGNAWWGA